MKEVHLVWTGTYSDADVVGVYEHLEHAEAIVAFYEELDRHRLWSSDARIETRIVDEHSPKAHPFRCRMTRDGTLMATVNDGDRVVRVNTDPCRYGPYREYPETFEASGITEDHAIKNCNDFRLAYLAGQFPNL